MGLIVATKKFFFFNHFVGLVLKGLKFISIENPSKMSCISAFIILEGKLSFTSYIYKNPSTIGISTKVVRLWISINAKLCDWKGFMYFCFWNHENINTFIDNFLQRWKFVPFTHTLHTLQDYNSPKQVHERYESSL